MAKRKSINKRLSRFSRSSTGSAILDPDTNILGSEYPYWWRNLENNTTARQSIDADVLNQTSRHLNSNSQIDTSYAVDEWWKALDSSNTSYSIKRNVKYRNKDSSSNTSTSGSGEEYGVVKKKLQFCANARSNNGNAFFNALNDSVAPTTANLVQGAKCKNPVNDTSSNSRTLTNFEQLDEMQGNNLNQSQSTGDVLKSKPEIFKKDYYKSQNRNAFVDVLKNWVEQKSPREGTSNTLINNESRIITSMATPENLDSTRARANQFALSFESETDLSRLPAPKAQSTLLEGSTSSVQDSNKNSGSSDIEYEIRKPKSKFMTHRCKSTERNLFENVLQSEEITDKVDGGDAVRVNDVAVGAVSEESPKHVDDINTSSSNKRSNCVAESAQDKKELSRSNRMIRTFTTSIDPSDISLEYCGVPKLKSKFLMGLNKNQNYNAFQDILVENDKKEEDIVNKLQGILSISQRKTSLRAEPDMFESRGVKNISVGESRNSSRIKGQSNVYAVEKSAEKALTKTQDVPEVQNAPLTLSQTNLSLHSISDAEPKEVEVATSRKSGRFSNKVHDKSVLPQMEETELLKIQEISNRQSGRDSGLQKKSSESEKTEAILEEDNRRNLNAALRETVSRVAKGDESPVTQDISKRQSGCQSSSQKRSYKRALNESESKTKDTSEGDSRNLRAVSEKLTSLAVEESEALKSQDVSKRQSGRKTRSQKRPYRQDRNESESRETKGMLERDGKNLSVATRRTASPAKKGDASPSTQDILKSRSGRQIRLQKQSFSRNMMVFESEKEDTLEQNSRNLSTVSGKLTSHVLEETKALKPQDALKRQSGRQTRSQKRSRLEYLIEAKSDETECIFEQNSKNLRGVEEFLNVLQAGEAQGTTKSKSGHSRKSEKDLYTAISFESEQDAIVDTMSRKSGRLTKGKTQTASPKKVATLITEEEGDVFNDGSSWKRRKSSPSNLEKQNGRFDKTQAPGLVLSAVDDPELEEAQSNTKQQKKQSKTTGAEEGEHIVGEIESDKIQNNTSRQTDRLSEPGANLERIAINKNNNEIIQETQSLSMNVITDPNIKRMRKSGMQDKRLNELEASTLKEVRVQNNKNTPRGASNTSISPHCSNIGRPTNNARKFLPSIFSTNAFKGQQSIMSFFHAAKPVPASQVFSDEQQMEKLKKELDRVKTCEMERMMKERSDDKIKSSTQEKRIKRVGKTPRAGEHTQRATKKVHKAFMVNGEVYKVPRMPRPRYWITDRLYNYLWKRMESKYNLATRVMSEKFVQQLSDVTSVILKRKSYPYYKAELYALMKEMARLGIIHTRNDFYLFCHDFLPYELRVKMVPMLFPGNKRNIPYNVNKLHESILDS